MRWITGITLDNFKAFRGPYEPIVIPPKKHLLIYGENGSGKSSIYYALKDFFNSSEDPTKPFSINYFARLADNHAQGSVNLYISRFDEQGNLIDENPYTFHSSDEHSTHRIQPIQLANKVKGFLDYKRLLKTHNIPTREGENPNLFELVIKDILADHLIHRIGGGVATYPLLAEWQRYKEPIYNLDRRYHDFWNAHNELPQFTENVRILLTDIFGVFRRFIVTYFDPKLDVNVLLSPLEFNPDPWGIKQELFFDIRYAGAQIPEYHLFLNEARLSALAISLYLAALKTYPPEASDLKVLFLDDVFIGLDTSNRFPLLEIIKNEFINEKFQVFISTYDREWFELSRHWFQTKLPGQFTALELFIDDGEDPAIPDAPIILPYEGHLSKAKAHFRSKDYPAAGNYLRKECESIIKRFLPETFRIDGNGNAIEELELLMRKLEEYFEHSGFEKPQALMDSVKIYRKALLNPTSHSDLKSSLFKREIEEAFAIVEALNNLPELERKLIFNKGTVFRYENPDKEYILQLVLVENLFLTEYDGRKSFSRHRFSIKTWTRNGIEFAMDEEGIVMPEEQREETCDQIRPLDEIFTGICGSLGIERPENLYAEMRIGETGTMNDYLI